MTYVKLEIENIILNNHHETGTVIYAGDGITTITGLPNVQAGELLIQLNNIADQNKRVSIPTCAQMLGCVVDTLGNPLDNVKTVISETNVLPVDIKAPGIIPRRSVHEPMLTGVKAVDTILPTGKRQRELIIRGCYNTKIKSYCFLSNRNQANRFLLNTPIIKRNFSNIPAEKESPAKNINPHDNRTINESPNYTQPIAPLPNSTIFSKVFSIFSTVLLFSLIRNGYMNTAGLL
jgi:hypothetical protein